MKRHLLDPSIGVLLLDCFIGTARFEHEAVEARPGPSGFTDPIAFTADLYHQMGYKIIRQTKEIAFLQRDSHRIELILPGTPEHYAWTFPYGDEGIGFFEEQIALLRVNNLFSFIEQDGDAKRAYALFRHIESGVVVQVIWRRKQLFKGIFPGKPRR